jgi:hypothetical protein
MAHCPEKEQPRWYRLDAYKEFSTMWLKWRMFHRLNDKGDNSLTEIPGKEN